MPPPLRLWLFVAVLWPGVASSPYAAPDPRNAVRAATLAQRSTSVSLNYVQRWAAIGDSFTAGIGSGDPMGYLGDVDGGDAWKCSRYQYSWPQIVERRLGPGNRNFQFPACSGARSGAIYEQAQSLQGNLDVVMLTAGGNDLCLAAMIRRCVILPYSGEAGCNALIAKAEENIATILKPNIREVLNALKPKMRSDGKGIVVYLGYAPFFDTRNEDCANNQQWHVFEWMKWKFWDRDPLLLTAARREKFNSLVDKINRAIAEVVKEFALQEAGDKKYDIVFTDWSQWPKEVDGQFCSPSSSGDYPDQDQPNLLFFKWPTKKIPHRLDLKKRSAPTKRDAEIIALGGVAANDSSDVAQALSGIHDTIYDSPLFISANPRAVALNRLDRRAPAPPDCPGDGEFDFTLGLGMPDSFGKIFHPNEKGHEAMASFALQSLGVVKDWQDAGEDESATCSYEPEVFRCWRQAYKVGYDFNFVQWGTLNDVYEEFCDEAAASDSDGAGWKFMRTYNSGTPEWVDFWVGRSNSVDSFSRSTCVAALRRIMDGCDGGDDKNPLNLKYGGSYQKGSFTYEIKPQWRRVLFTKVDARCRARYIGGYTSYSWEGKGWLGADNGVALRDRAKGCIGPGGLWRWEFEYYDDTKEHDGWEWRAYFRAHLGANNRCFNNLHVQKKAGGYSHKAKRNPEAEESDDFGCSGGASGDRDGDW